jgi:hypothetical protein
MAKCLHRLQGRACGGSGPTAQSGDVRRPKQTPDGRGHANGPAVVSRGRRPRWLLATQVLEIHGSVAVAGSTLAAAALFNPLRRRVQRTVDRRFNRARYDADQTVTAFAARLKDAVDLDSVRDDLAATVEQALEPAYVSVWISLL